MTHQLILELKNIQHTYKQTSGQNLKVLQGVNLQLSEGESVAITGASGAGKSTLLHLAGLLEKPTQGEIWLNGAKTNTLGQGRKAKLRGKYCGFVYQQHHLQRDFTALENVLMPARINGIPASAAHSRAHQLLQQVGLHERAHHIPARLSGGEQQRVAIARALMNKPHVLLVDEPTGNLDPKTANEISELMFDLIQQNKMAMLMVTHNPELAKRCTRQLELNNGKLG